MSTFFIKCRNIVRTCKKIASKCLIIEIGDENINTPISSDSSSAKNSMRGEPPLLPSPRNDSLKISQNPKTSEQMKGGNEIESQRLSSLAKPPMTPVDDCR
uniref:Uncharacterized protein n=1 Tax=Kalanchoe fedtschenkoi TaxID=63787 RepID=A0A7N0TXX1_KALFE